MSYVVVLFPEPREVYIDDQGQGSNRAASGRPRALFVNAGTHTFRLGRTNDVDPAEQTVDVPERSILDPFRVELVHQRVGAGGAYSIVDLYRRWRARDLALPTSKSIPADPRRRDWFDTATFFIPGMLGEPWLGDIRERRDKMATEGYTQRTIELAKASQLILLIGHWLIDKLMDIATPFKKRQSAD